MPPRRVGQNSSAQWAKIHGHSHAPKSRGFWRCPTASRLAAPRHEFREGTQHRVAPTPRWWRARPRTAPASAPPRTWRRPTASSCPRSRRPGTGARRTWSPAAPTVRSPGAPARPSSPSCRTGHDGTRDHRPGRRSQRPDRPPVLSSMVVGHPRDPVVVKARIGRLDHHLPGRIGFQTEPAERPRGS